MLDKIKLLIGITEESQDNLLNIIIDSINARLKILLGVDIIPKELEYIVVDVAIARFNRIGSEGAASHSIEGESINFESDFEAYMPEINAYRDSNSAIAKGKVRFL